MLVLPLVQLVLLDARSATSVVGCALRMQLVLLDARAAIDALAKGRSSTWSFTPILRRCAAIAFPTDMQLCLRWIPGEAHPADATSRRFQPGRGLRGVLLGEAANPPAPHPLRGRIQQKNGPGVSQGFFVRLLFLDKGPRCRGALGSRIGALPYGVDGGAA